jgi:hypothetical protein
MASKKATAKEKLNQGINTRFKEDQENKLI